MDCKFMSGEQNTVFISYRRSASKHLAGQKCHPVVSYC
jgi:hypothetical protein